MIHSTEFQQQAAAQLVPLRGFDRLANAGMSDDEIAVIRRQFHAESGLSSTDFLENDIGEGEDCTPPSSPLP